jgi:hypothetical protein
MLAILEVSLRDATQIGRNASPRRKIAERYRVANRRAKQRLAADARAWIFDDGDSGIFSFASVCDALGLDAANLRARVRRGPVEKLKPKVRKSRSAETRAKISAALRARFRDRRAIAGATA